MKAVSKIAIVAILSLSPCAAQTSNPRYDPAPLRPSEQQKSFVDFALGKFNSRDIDYGERIEQWRQGELDSTVRDYGFWADVFAVCMLGTAFIIIYRQHRKTQNVRFLTARLVTGYQNELAQARAYGARLSAEYTRLKRLTEEKREEASSARIATGRRDNSIAASTANRSQLAHISNGQFSTDRDGGGENETLKQQTAQLNTTISKLRHQVTTLTQKLEQEQEKNRKLRGE